MYAFEQIRLKLLRIKLRNIDNVLKYKISSI